jgi:type VI secretion system lysozyme-like protein
MRNRDDGDGPSQTRASILDRLIDDDPGIKPERPPFRTQNRAQFGRSILRDLQLLLNTRTTFEVGVDEKERRRRKPEDRTVLDLGLSDFTHLHASSEEDRNLLARQIRETIAAFEPRLEVRKVRVLPVEGHRNQCEVRVEAWLIMDHAREPVSFGLKLDSSEGVVEVNGG